MPHRTYQAVSAQVGIGKYSPCHSGTPRNPTRRELRLRNSAKYSTLMSCMPALYTHISGSKRRRFQPRSINGTRQPYASVVRCASPESAFIKSGVLPSEPRMRRNPRDRRQIGLKSITRSFRKRPSPAAQDCHNMHPATRRLVCRLARCRVSCWERGWRLDGVVGSVGLRGVASATIVWLLTVGQCR